MTKGWDGVSDFYEEDEPLSKIMDIASRPADGVTRPPLRTVMQVVTSTGQIWEWCSIHPGMLYRLGFSCDKDKTLHELADQLLAESATGRSRLVYRQRHPGENYPPIVFINDSNDEELREMMRLDLQANSLTAEDLFLKWSNRDLSMKEATAWAAWGDIILEDVKTSRP